MPLTTLPLGATKRKLVFCLKVCANLDTIPVMENPVLTNQHVADNAHAVAFLRMSALITCALPLSAFQWSKTNFTPVVINVGEDRFLGLADKSIFDYEQYSFYLAEAEPYLGWIDRKRYVLVAWRRNGTYPAEIVPFFPADTTVAGDEG
jgi:hypothetical protein